MNKNLRLDQNKNNCFYTGSYRISDVLARYSHRVAITNRRLISISKTHVSFKYKDYGDRAKQKVLRITGEDFLKRFCLHIMPNRFRKVRHYGFLSNASKTKSLRQARQAFSVHHEKALDKKARKELAEERLFGNHNNLCPKCKKGQFVIRDVFASNKSPPYA